MAPPLVLHVRREQVTELQQLRDHDPTPYLREKAAAILQVASGQSLRAVAATGLLRPRRRETIATWVQRSLAEGPARLRVRSGRGRKPAFSPPGHGGGTRGAGSGGPPLAAAVRAGAQSLALARSGVGPPLAAGPRAGQDLADRAPAGGAV